MLRLYACMVLEHDPFMAALSAAICVVSCVTAFHLARQVDVIAPQRRTRWFLLLAGVTGTGIWATHFVAMLAYRPGLPTVFLAGPTIASILVAAGSAYVGWRILNSGRTRVAVEAGAAFAAGIAAMHYTGMAALRLSGRFHYDAEIAGAAILVGFILAVFAAHVFAVRPRAAIPSGALLAGAICVIHFGSMTAVSVRADPTVHLPYASLDAEVLTGIVVMGVVALMGIALATAIYEDRLARAALGETGRLKKFTQSALEGLVILDGETIIDANETFWCIAGYDPAQPPTDLRIAEILPDHWARQKHLLGPAFFEGRLLGTDGGCVEVETAVRTIHIGGTGRDAVIVRDITERKAAAARIAHLAAHDALTGVGNRRSFVQELDKALVEASEAAPVAMLCLDLDRFKAVNDIHGHPVGDAVLIETARRIRDCLSRFESFARLGGDEFAIVQRGHRQPEAATQLAQRIIAALNEVMQIGDLTIHLGSSIGIALAPFHAGDAENLHKKADLALYRAKAEGRRTFRFFDNDMDEQLLFRRRLEVDLRAALERDELYLHYQPIACLESERITGFEVLVRWDHAALGAVSPADFIPVAEESGLILTIGEAVLRKACVEAAAWNQPLRVAVNLSPLQIANGNIVDTVRLILAETGLAADRLELEITEGVLVRDPEKSVAALRELQALGVHIAMDDFGTGYSSLGYFRTFPFDQVKIDQSFVSDVTRSSEALAIVKAIIGLGKGLGMSIVAEGIETREQMLLLREEGCGKAQGYFIGRPGPIETFDHLWARCDRNIPAPARSVAAGRSVRPAEGVRPLDLV